MNITFNIRIFRRKKSGEVVLQNPERDWLVMLIGTVVCVVGISLYHIYFYNLVESGRLYETRTTEGQIDAVLDVDRIKGAITVMNERENWTEVLSSKTSKIVDPSQ